MTTRRRIICSILSALFLSSCAALSSDSSQRIVRVKVLADVPFRARNPHWVEEARGLVESASDYYEREFAIRLITQSVSPWPDKERMASTPELLAILPDQANFSGPDLLVYAKFPRLDTTSQAKMSATSVALWPKYTRARVASQRVLPAPAEHAFLGVR